MPKNDPDAWILELSLEQLQDEAAARGLVTAGTISALRARVTRYERAGRRDPVPPSPAVDASNTVFDLPVEEGSEGAVGGGAELGLPDRDDLDQSLPGPKKPGPLPLKREALARPPTTVPSTARVGIPPTLSMPRDEVPTAFEPRAVFRSSIPESRARNSERTLSASDAYNTMRRWNVSFLGTRGSDVETFLTRIEEGRDLVPIADGDLLKCLPFFLTGIALQWYRVKKSRWHTWREFEAAARVRFGDPDYQFALRDEIMRRTQGEQEPVADYLTCLLGLLGRLDPSWSLVEQLNYAHRNMLPRLQLAVHRDDFADFDALERLATRVERSYLAASQYRAPPPPERSTFPDFAYRPPPRSSRPSTTMTVETQRDIGVQGSGAVRGEERPRADGTPRRPERTTPPTPERATRPPAAQTGVAGAGAGSGTPRETAEASSSRPTSRSRTAKCWNCDATGHFSRECREPPRVHCYRCGRTQQTVRTCPACAGNAVGRR